MIFIECLTEAGLDIPNQPLASEPELALYAHLQQEHDDAYILRVPINNRSQLTVKLTRR